MEFALAITYNGLALALPYSHRRGCCWIEDLVTRDVSIACNRSAMFMEFWPYLGACASTWP